jgi:hypothetical protein
MVTFTYWRCGMPTTSKRSANFGLDQLFTLAWARWQCMVPGAWFEAEAN